jgi:5'-3' exonuclease
LETNLYDSQDKDVLNIILSKDKDLLQCLQYENTYQFVSNYKRSQKSKFSRLFENADCLEYIYPNFKRGCLNGEHVSIVLAICGDKSDGVDGVKGIGPAKACDLVQNYKIPTNYDEIKNYQNHPDVIKNNLDLILTNFKQVDFREQIKRIPRHLLEA